MALLQHSTTINFGDYSIKHTKRNKTKLIISVSSFGIAQKEVEWEFQGLYKQENFDIVFIKDNCRSWFNSKNGFNSLIEFIVNYIKNNNFHSVYSLGLSSGAFGAILLSHYLKINRVIAFSPQTVLNKNARKDWDTRWNEYLSIFEGKFLHDDLTNFANQNSNIHIICGDRDIKDLKHAYRLAPYNNVEIYSIPYVNHNTATFLKQNNLLYPVIDSFLNLNTDKYVKELISGWKNYFAIKLHKNNLRLDINSKKSLENFNEQYFVDKEKSLLNLIKIDCSNPEFHRQIGKFYAENKMFERAVTAYNSAVFLAHNCYLDTYFYELSLIYNQHLNIEQAIECIDEYIKNYSANADTYHHLGNLYFAKGEFAKSEETHRKSIYIASLENRQNSEYYNALSIALYSQQKIEEAFVIWQKSIEISQQFLPEKYHNYQLNTTIDFSSGQSSYLYLGRGWYKSEKTGTWTNGIRSEISMSLSKMEANDLLFSIFMRPFLHKNHPQLKANFRVNDVELTSWNFSYPKNANFQKFDVIIPKDLIKDRRLDIHLNTIFPNSPFACGFSQDPRFLGLHVQNILIKNK